MENRTSMCARTAALDVQHRARSGRGGFLDKKGKKQHTHTHTHTHPKRGREGSDRGEGTIDKHSDLTLQFCQQQVCFSVTSFLLQLFHQVSADIMKLVHIGEWVLCCLAGSVYYSLCGHGNWWFYCAFFFLFSLSSSISFKEICAAATCCDSPVPEDL